MGVGEVTRPALKSLDKRQLNYDIIINTSLIIIVITCFYIAFISSQPYHLICSAKRRGKITIKDTMEY